MYDNSTSSLFLQPPYPIFLSLLPPPSSHSPSLIFFSPYSFALKSDTAAVPLAIFFIART